MSKEERERERKAREKAYRKEGQKLAIQALGRSAVSEKNKDKESIKTKGEKEMKEATTMLKTTGSSFQDAVKGQFGKKVVEVLEEQKQTLDSFSR